MSLSIIWHSAPAFYPTGYGVQTANFVSRMIDAGHECVVLTTTQQPGIMWNGIMHVPGGNAKYGADGLLEWPKRVKTDIMFSLFDIWPFPEDIGKKMEALGTAWAPITPIDHDPIPPIVLSRLRGAQYPIAMSPHGFREMQRVGLEKACYIPHGVDTHVFRPRQPNKDLFMVNAETFVVGVIATNVEPLDRKGWYPTLAAFGKFHAKHPDSILYVHATAGREDGGYDLIQIAESLNFKLHVPDMWTLTAGIPVLKMVELYNSMDVMMLLTRGEGFCIPLIEAQSCGVPVITTDFTAPADLVGAGWKVPITGTRYTPMNSFWGEPDIEAGARALEQCYQLWRAGELREEMQQKARNFAKTFDFDLVYKTYMRPFLEKAEAEIREKQNAAKTVMSEYGKRPPPNKGEEFIVVNSGREKVTDVEVGGRAIHLLGAGATVYDRNLALEIKDKYRNNLNVKVIEKPYVSLNDGHRSTFVVPELPWKKETRPRVEPPTVDETDALSANDRSGG